jgi:hypothetical protein
MVFDIDCNYDSVVSRHNLGTSEVVINNIYIWELDIDAEGGGLESVGGEEKSQRGHIKAIDQTS